MDEEDYKIRQEEERKAFMDIPIPCRDAVGKVFYKDSKLDWEIRAFLAPPMYQYVLSKLNEEEATRYGDEAKVKKLKDKRAELLDSTMQKLFERFPDCSPDHSLRQIKKSLGSKAAAKYRAVSPLIHPNPHCRFLSILQTRRPSAISSHLMPDG